MKSPPISPYGVFAGHLFQYTTGGPSLIAFESSRDKSLSVTKKCILLGGLSDGPIPCPYTKLLEGRCHELGWSLVQPVLSSSYLGFGNGGLDRDTDEIAKLMTYLVCHHRAESFALVGHSTGCQNAVHFLASGDRELVNMIKVVALQAPVSDRESMSLTPGDHDASIQYARSLVADKKGDEMMPRDAFWAPITASRYISLFDLGGDDDFFSSDLSDSELSSRLGHIGRIGVESGLRLLAAFSGRDEYVPQHVIDDYDNLMKRLVLAMNNGDPDGSVAKGMMIGSGNHNLSSGASDGEKFVEAVGGLLASNNVDQSI